MPQIPHDLGNAGAHQESLEALLNSIVADLNELKTKFNAHTHTANDTAVIEGQQVALTLTDDPAIPEAQQVELALTDDPAIPSAQRPTIGTTASS